MQNAKSSKQNGKTQKFTDLHTWQYGHELVLSIYKATKNFPKEEVFSLTSQMRRVAVSITSNIAEGFGRRSQKDKVHFYTMGQGSLTELQNQLIISQDINYLTNQEANAYLRQSETVHKLLTGLIKSIQGDK